MHDAHTQALTRMAQLFLYFALHFLTTSSSLDRIFVIIGAQMLGDDKMDQTPDALTLTRRNASEVSRL